MNCPKCQSSDYRKDGTLGGVQRYLCKNCLYRYGEEKSIFNQPVTTKKIALEMYSGGLNQRLIANVLKIKNETLKQWMKEWGSCSSLPKSNHSIEIKNFKELQNYLNSKISNTQNHEVLLIVDLKEGATKIFIEDDEK